MKVLDSLVIVKHRRGCRALASAERGDWDRPWGPPPWRVEHGPSTLWLTKTGRKSPKRRGEVMWIVFMCNDTQCPARLVVQLDAILRAFGRTTP
jgi:hypothetical protein